MPTEEEVKVAKRAKLEKQAQAKALAAIQKVAKNYKSTPQHS